MGSESTSRRTRAAVLQAVRDAGETTRADLAERTGVSVATISRAVAQLIDQRILVEELLVGDHGGRPLGWVRVRARAATVLAVDVADHHTSIAVIDLAGEVVHREVESNVPSDPEQRLDHTLDAIERQWRRAREADGAVAVGVSIPGPVQSSGHINFAPALQWQDVPLGETLRARLGVPVAVSNDANLIAMAESRWGAHRESVSLVALAVFEGIGAGIVEGGALIEGSRGFGGQIGRMLVGRESIDRQFLDFGDLESQLGSVGLQARARTAGLCLDPDAEVFAALFAPQAGDAVDEDFVAAVYDEFAVALANVIALLDPETIVLAGRFAPITDAVVPELERRLTGRVLHVPALVPPSTSIDGALLGAAASAWDAFGPLDRLLV